MNAEETKLWKRYIRKPSDELRNELAMRYLPVAKKIAGKFAGTIIQIAYDEFLSAASLGLLQAIPKFRLDRGVNPNTFFAFRITGEIKDYLRSQDYLSRKDRQALTIVDKWAEREFAAGRRVSDDDIVDKFGKLPVLTESRSIDSVVVAFEKRNLTGADSLIAKTEPVRDSLSELLRSLSQKERLIVLLYAEGVTMKNIGREIGLSEARVSLMVKELRPRLHDSAVRHGFGWFFKGDRDALPSRLRKAV